MGEVTRAGEYMLEFSYRPPEFDTEEDRVAYLDGAVDALRKIHWWRDQHARPLATASQGLRYHVESVTGQQPQVTQRLKRVPTMIDKLHRHEKDHMELGRMWDIGGVRARLPDVDSVYAVVDRLGRWKARGRPHDYIENPKSDGYRAYHLYVEKSKRVIEIQLRTELQDTWANQVERDGRMGDQGYKFGRGHDSVRTYYKVVAEIFAAQDASQDVSPELRERFRRSYDALLETSDSQENQQP